MRRAAPLLLAALLAPLLTVVGPAQAATSGVTLRAKLEFTYSGFDKTSTHETFSGTAVGDVTGDGEPDVLAGAPDGFLRGWRLDGTKFLEHWVGPGAVHATPALVHLDGDGVLDVLTASIGGDVVGVRGDGRRVFHAQDRTDMPKRGVFGTPTVGDVDQDGEIEVVATSWDHHVHVWNLDGSYVPGWPRFVFDTIWSSPALADLDGDGWLEIVFGGDMDVYPGAPHPGGGLLWALRHDGTNQPGWPRSLAGQVIWSTPAIVDLDGDGRLDVVVGTGLNFREPAGRRVWAVKGDGTNVAGWPVAVGGRVMGSPAVGDVTGDGRPDVVTLANDGVLNVHRADGTLAWSRCVVSEGYTCRERYGVHGQATIGDVDDDGAQEIVVAGEHWLRVLDGRHGFVEAAYPMPGVWAPPAAPEITEIDGEAWIVLNTTVNTRDDGAPGIGDTQTVWLWSTGQPLGTAEWPSFKKNVRRTSMVIDDARPTASVAGLASLQPRTSFGVGWEGSDQGLGVAVFDVQFRRAGEDWFTWRYHTADRSAPFFGLAGEKYDFRVRAIDKASNVGQWSAATTATVADDAVSHMPFRSMYAVAADGQLAAYSSPPVGHPSLPTPLGRDVAMNLDGKGGYVLDGWGGLHPFGNAPPASGATGYWPGWNIARGLALNPDGASGYVADGFGGLHPFGGAKKVVPTKKWPGKKLTRDVVVLPTSTPGRPGGYVLDARGGVHPFGDAPKLGFAGRRWDFRIARAFALNPQGRGGWILDGWGGIHPVGGAPKVAAPAYWPGWDIARGLVPISATQGYVLDGHGGVHPYGGAPRPQADRYWGHGGARALAVAR